MTDGSHCDYLEASVSVLERGMIVERPRSIRSCLHRCEDVNAAGLGKENRAGGRGNRCMTGAINL